MKNVLNVKSAKHALTRSGESLFGNRRVTPSTADPESEPPVLTVPDPEPLPALLLPPVETAEVQSTEARLKFKPLPNVDSLSRNSGELDQSSSPHEEQQQKPPTPTRHTYAHRRHTTTGTTPPNSERSMSGGRLTKASANIRPLIEESRRKTVKFNSEPMQRPASSSSSSSSAEEEPGEEAVLITPEIDAGGEPSPGRRKRHIVREKSASPRKAEKLKVVETRKSRSHSVETSERPLLATVDHSVEMATLSSTVSAQAEKLRVLELVQDSQKLAFDGLLAERESNKQAFSNMMQQYMALQNSYDTLSVEKSTCSLCALL